MKHIRGIDMNHTTHFQVVIIGGGASGLMCALTAARQGRRVLLLEHTSHVGKKILISGVGAAAISPTCTLKRIIICLITPTFASQP
jgi:predicted flavoprotein YhiN